MSLEIAIALMSDLRACSAGTCLRCGGPYQPGDRVVPVAKTPWAESGACHRSCWFTSESELRKFRTRRAQSATEQTTDPRQISLFDQPASITESSQIRLSEPDSAGSADHHQRPRAAGDQ